jgi:hypothetical protein
MEQLEGTKIGIIFRLNGETGMIGQALQINPKLVQPILFAGLSATSRLKPFLFKKADAFIN